MNFEDVQNLNGILFVVLVSTINESAVVWRFGYNFVKGFEALEVIPG